MASRPNLHEELCELLESRNVYYDPPESIKMQYPAIVYALSRIDNDHADNGVYIQTRAYDVTVIYKEAENAASQMLACLPLCSFNRHYKADNLNHDVYTLYY
jgi:hypothetical protein